MDERGWRIESIGDGTAHLSNGYIPSRDPLWRAIQRCDNMRQLLLPRVTKTDYVATVLGLQEKET